ncbi:CdaR family protein [Acidobacteria bacterium AH-259-G07]|nr:CdaR family protein [Acidobacteria bacterium AH-259-G07]
MNILRAFFLKNLGLKVISVLLAFLLWLTITVPEMVQRTLSLPVEFVNMPSQLEISDDYDKEVEVVIRSDRSTSTLDERNLAVVIDLKGAVPGTELIRLTEGNIRNKPSGVEILFIDPARIRLQLESTLRKIVEVTPELVGNPANGFEVTNVRVIPSEVMISGPKSRVLSVSTAKTEPIAIEGHSSTLRLNAYLDLEDPRLRIENTPSVNMVVTIEEKRREVRIPGIPIQVLPHDTQAPLITQRAEIIGTVPLSFAGELKPEDFRATVNVEELEPRREPYELVPQVTVSEEYAGVFQLKSWIPERVKVRKIR